MWRGGISVNSGIYQPYGSGWVDISGKLRGGRGGEVAAEGEVEVDAVEDAGVFEADHGGARVVGAALGFEDGEDVGVDAFGVFALGEAFGEGCLLEFGGELGFLCGE